MDFKGVISELRRRNIFRVATAYAIAGWLIIQICTSTFPYLNLPEWLITAIIIFVLIGFPISIIFAWAFELTPDGIQKSNEVDITASVTASTGKKLNGIIIGVLSVAVFFLVVERVFFAKSTVLNRNNGEASVAVLPFADLSPDGDQEYFSDGLSEELLNVLAKVEDMKVAGRTSSFKFKGMNEDLKLIGDQLGVDHILEGSVRKAGNTIRITAQLIKVEDGYHMWSETYDREYTAENIFRIQDEISQKVLNELKVRLLNEDENIAALETIPTEDVEAYEAYLRGTELLRGRNPDEIKLAIKQFERATELDPSFAKAYAYISFSYARLYDYGNIDKNEVADLIRTFADRALFINSDLAYAYSGLSSYYGIKEDTLNSINAQKKAFELNPNDAIMVNSYAVTLDKFDKEGWEPLYQRAYKLDPLSPVIAGNYASFYRSEKDYDKAIEILDKNIEVNPEYIRSYTQKIYILNGEGFGLRDKGFIQAYEGYQRNSGNLGFIQLLRESATYFMLDSLETFLANEVIRLYPNNPAAFRAQRVLDNQKIESLLDNKKFKEARAFAESNFQDLIQSNPILFERFFSNAEAMSRFTEAFDNEEYDTVFELLPNFFPEYFSDTLSTHVEDVTNTMRVKFLFEQVGRDDLVQNLNKLQYEYPDDIELEYNKDVTQEAPYAVYWIALESQYNNDLDRMAEVIEELYFNRKFNFYKWSEYFEFPDYKALLINEKLKDVIERIEADQKRMKDNVVAFLKDEGEWKEEWEVKEN